jgi:AcrR family transcriptional regulator
MVNMRSPDDRTARARIRDEALVLLAARGPGAVTIREVAAAAQVSPALVIRHYGSKDGLRAAVDDHVADVVETLLTQVSDPTNATAASQELPSLAEGIARLLPADSAVPGYLARMLLDGGPAGTALFARLYAAAGAALVAMVAAGTADNGPDPAVRAAFLLANDLAVLILRDHLAGVLGVDPLSAAGLQRWGSEVFAVYGAGLGGAPHHGDAAASPTTGPGGH